MEKLEEICEDMMLYKVHKDKQGIARFSKSVSKTMKAIKQLKDRGVKVQL
jgi:hypothetical protein